MKFQSHNILENRNGIQIFIIKADPNTKEYHYKYLNVSDPQFQGIFCHSFDDIELYWSLVPITKKPFIVGNSYTFAEEFQSKSRLNRTGDSCSHDLVLYEGFREKYKFCKNCDQKFKV